MWDAFVLFLVFIASISALLLSSAIASHSFTLYQYATLCNSITDIYFLWLLMTNLVHFAE
ncbi:hypothetical protein BH11BAC6_BH11BAC6_03380 [soil metagenome]